LIPIAFEEAIERTADRRRHLLLGNGFSIAAWPRFDYGALVGTVVGQSPRIEELFDRFQTVDFERIARALLETREVLAVHDGTKALIEAVEGDYHELKRLLVSAITKIHPPEPREFGKAEYTHGVAFLKRFLGPKDGGEALRGKVFTTSYDLLLYWTLMEGLAQLNCDDGFRSGPWKRRESQTVFYLHGALHLVEERSITRKRSGQGRLIRTAGKRIDKGDVPLFISEGSSQEKRVRIAESDYLTAASECLAAACDDAEARLFVFGHSLRDEDAHIFEKISEGQVSEVFVSVRPADEPEAHAQMQKAAELWVAKRTRRGGPPLAVFRYDPAEARSWG
jgi:hypothetical protein